MPELELLAVTVRVEFAAAHALHGGTITVDGVNVVVGSEGLVGVTVALRGTGPEKRLNVLMVIVEFAFWPGTRVREVGLEFSVKIWLQNWPP